MSARTNQPAATIIDLAVILRPAVGTQEAARMLRRHQIPLAAALRVLTTSRRRRVDVQYG